MTTSGEQPVWMLAKPHKRVRGTVEVKGGVAIIRLEDGGIAVVPKQEVCRLAERFNLELRGVKC